MSRRSFGERTRRSALLAGFLSLAGACSERDKPSEVLWSADAQAVENPWPSDRLLVGGIAGTPSGYFGHVLPEQPDFVAARQFLDTAAASIAPVGGYSVSAPIVVRLSREIDPASLTGVHLYSEAGGADLGVSLSWSAALRALLVEPGAPLLQKSRYVLAIADPRVEPSRDFRDALASDAAFGVLGTAAVARGVASRPADLDLVLVFTTQPVADGLQAVQSRVDGALGDALLPSYAAGAIPGMTIGIFNTGEMAFTQIFDIENARSTGIQTLAQGSWSGFDFRGAGDLFEADLLTGTTTPPAAPVDFRLMIPKGTPPAGGWPVVIVSHGLSGDSREPLQRAYSFGEAGMAVIGLTAPDHGYRGSILDFFDFTGVLKVRDAFRQSDAEILQIERMLRNAKAGAIAPFDQLDTERVTYFGNSFGGILGGGVAATSSRLDAVGLTVTGGRLPILLDGEAGNALYQIFLAGVGFPSATEYAQYEEDYKEAFRIIAQWAIDPGDGASLAPYTPPSRRILIQEALGDLTILNESTEALRIAQDLPVTATPADPFTGRGAMWVWDRSAYVGQFPAGTQAHDLYWELAPMRHQMENFLISDGTRLTAQ